MKNIILPFKKITLIVSFYLLTLAAFAQGVKQGTYDSLYKIKNYTTLELDSIFGSNLSAEKEYLAYKYYKIKAKNSILIGIGLSTITYLSIYTYSNHNKETYSNLDLCEAVIVYLGSLTIGTIMVTSSLIYSIRSLSLHNKSKMCYHKAVQQMNKGVGSLESQKEYFLDIGLTQNGVGIIYSF